MQQLRYTITGRVQHTAQHMTTSKLVMLSLLAMSTAPRTDEGLEWAGFPFDTCVFSVSTLAVCFYLTPPLFFSWKPHGAASLILREKLRVFQGNAWLLPG